VASSTGTAPAALSPTTTSSTGSTFGSVSAAGGFRFYDKNHEVSYNYVDGVYGGQLSRPADLGQSGDAEGSSTKLDAHWRVVNALVERNVLVGNPEGIRVGHNYSLAPTGCTVRDNIVAQAETGTAITQRIAPVSTTQTNNTYFSTPATGGLAQGSDTIWRKAGYGPRLTFLQIADVGPNADLGDTDGTGVLVGGGGTTPVADRMTAPRPPSSAGAPRWARPTSSSTPAHRFRASGASTAVRAMPATVAGTRPGSR
jgi:hypothetical protein